MGNALHSILPTPLPDESLYGLIGRAHRFNGATDGKATSEAFFSHKHAGLQHDFPFHLKAFCTNTSNAFGSTHDVINRLTVLPYFLRFKTAETRRLICDEVGGANIERLKYHLGLPAAPCRATLALRACPFCMEEDRAQNGVASWRRMHQLPGNLCCSIHQTRLLATRQPLNRLGRSNFLLPDDAGLFNAERNLPDAAWPILNRLRTWYRSRQEAENCQIPFYRESPATNTG